MGKSVNKIKRSMARKGGRMYRNSMRKKARYKREMKKTNIINKETSSSLTELQRRLKEEEEEKILFRVIFIIIIIIVIGTIFLTMYLSNSQY